MVPRRGVRDSLPGPSATTESDQIYERTDTRLPEYSRPDLRTELDDRLLDRSARRGKGPRDDAIGTGFAQCDRVRGDLVDGAGQGKGVDMTIGDQRQQRQIGCHPSGVGRSGDR